MNIAVSDLNANTSVRSVDRTGKLTSTMIKAVKVMKRNELNKVTWPCYGTKGIASGYASFATVWFS